MDPGGDYFFFFLNNRFYIFDSKFSFFSAFNLFYVGLGVLEKIKHST